MQNNNRDLRRSEIRPDVRRKKRKNQRKKVIIIALISAIFLAVFAVLSAKGIVNIRSLLGRDGPSYEETGLDTEKFIETPEETLPDSEPDVSDAEKDPTTTGTAQSTETEPVETEPPVTTWIDTEIDTEPDTELDTEFDTEIDTGFDTEPDTEFDTDFDTTDELPFDSDDTSTDEDSTDDTTDDTTESWPDDTSDVWGDGTSDSESGSTEDSESDVSESGSESGDEEVLTPPENRFEWPCVLGETEPADDDYFADTLFIGDSRMQGIEYACSKESKATFFTAVSVTASQIATRQGVKMLVNGQIKNVSIIDAIRISDRQFKRIYMMFGINELGTYGGSPAIIKQYRLAVERVMEIQPEAEICIIGVMPVFNSKDYVSGYTGYEANPRILDLNIALIELANEMKLHYLDAYHLFMTEDGQLRGDVSKDGIHLLGNYSKQLMEYVKTHAITD